MKVCTICKNEKSLDEFSLKKTSIDGRQSECKKCYKIYQRNWYKLNKKKHLKTVYENTVRYTKINQQFVIEYLSNHPCVDCGDSRIEVLEFDHVRGKKIKSIAKMIRRVSLDILKDEIKKCDVRCANCHRIKTIKQLKWYKINTSETFSG